MTNFTVRRQIIARIEAKLVAAQQLRETDSLAWIDRERSVMHDEVNQIRRELGQAGPVSMEHIRRAETYASGHTDYTHKFALYCAEIVLDDPRWSR